jgi:hypothetical protein
MRFLQKGEEKPDLASWSLILITKNSSKKEKQKEKEGEAASYPLKNRMHYIIFQEVKRGSTMLILIF